MTRLSLLRRFCAALAAVVLLDCGPTGPASADTQLRVVASIKPVHSLVSAVMTGVGDPYLIMRGAVSPHTFTMRPSAASALEDADIVFVIGESMEVSLIHPIESLAGAARVIALSEVEGLVRRPLREGGAFEADLHHAHDHDPRNHPKKDEHHEHDEGHGHSHEGGQDKEDVGVHEDDHHDGGEHDPFDLHIWLDPVNAWAMARAISATLAEADPANAATYETNLEALLHRLDALTEEIAADVAPARGKPFIVFHDGYRYFEDRFGLTAVGSAVVSPGRSPGVKRVRELRAKVRDLGVVCVFSEPQFNERLVDTLIEGTSVRAGTVDPLGAGIGDGPELYFTLLRRIAASFKDCLAPDSG